MPFDTLHSGPPHHHPSNITSSPSTGTKLSSPASSVSSPVSTPASAATSCTALVIPPDLAPSPPAGCKDPYPSTTSVLPEPPFGHATHRQDSLSDSAYMATSATVPSGGPELLDANTAAAAAAPNGSSVSLDLFADLPPDFDLMINDEDLQGSAEFTSGMFMDSSFVMSSFLDNDAADLMFDSTAADDDISPENTAAAPALKSPASMPNLDANSGFLQPSNAVGATRVDAAPNTRKRIPPEKTQILESSFQANPKPDRERRDSLARETGLPVRNIQVSLHLKSLKGI